MAITKYTYSISADTLNGVAKASSLKEELDSSSIIVAQDHIEIFGNTLDIYFKAAISTPEETTLDAVVAAHTGIIIVPTELEVDDQGRQVSRAAYGRKGWTYLAHPVEFTTSKLAACFSEDWTGTARTGITFKFYDSNGDELVAGTQAELDTDCVETRFTIAPGHDYEVISGKIEQHTTPSTTEDVRMWVVGGIIDTTTNYPWEYPAASGVYHVKEFAGGINLKFMGADQEIVTDGRASKFMSKDTTGVPYQSNQFQFMIKHPAGYKHELMIILEYFRA